MKKAIVAVSGELYVRILHSTSVEIDITDDMTEEEIEQQAKAELEFEYYQNIQPALNQLDDVTDEWEIRDHSEDVVSMDMEEAE